MNVGDRVRIIGITKSSEVTGLGVILHTFLASRGDTGTITEIRRSVPFGHSSKYYVVRLDPPNTGRMVFLGIKNMRRIK